MGLEQFRILQQSTILNRHNQEIHSYLLKLGSILDKGIILFQMFNKEENIFYLSSSFGLNFHQVSGSRNITLYLCCCD